MDSRLYGTRHELSDTFHDVNSHIGPCLSKWTVHMGTTLATDRVPHHGVATLDIEKTRTERRTSLLSPYIFIKYFTGFALPRFKSNRSEGMIGWAYPSSGSSSDISSNSDGSRSDSNKKASLKNDHFTNQGSGSRLDSKSRSISDSNQGQSGCVSTEKGANYGKVLVLPRPDDTAAKGHDVNQIVLSDDNSDDGTKGVVERNDNSEASPSVLRGNETDSDKGGQTSDAEVKLDLFRGCTYYQQPLLGGIPFPIEIRPQCIQALSNADYYWETDFIDTCTGALAFAVNQDESNLLRVISHSITCYGDDEAMQFLSDPYKEYNHILFIYGDATDASDHFVVMEIMKPRQRNSGNDPVSHYHHIVLIY